MAERLSLPVRVKNTFITADNSASVDEVEDGLAKRQVSAPPPRVLHQLSGASPLRQLWASYEVEDRADEVLKDAALAPDKTEWAHRRPGEETAEPEMEPPQVQPRPHRTQALRSAMRVEAPSFFPIQSPAEALPGGSGHAQQQQPQQQHALLPFVPPLPGNRQTSEGGSPLKKALQQYRVSFDDPPAAEQPSGGGGPPVAAGDEIIDPEELEDLQESFPWSRLVTGGSEAAEYWHADAQRAQGSGSGSAAAPAPALGAYVPGMLHAGMVATPAALALTGAVAADQAPPWPGQGVQPTATAPQQQQQQQPQPQPTPRQQQQQLPGQQRQQQQWSSATRHSRGRGSLIDIAKREQALRQQQRLQPEAFRGALAAAAGGEAAVGRQINFCPYCRGKVQPHYRFCQFCGSSLALW